MNDVIEKTNVELNTSKVQLSQLQRSEHHALQAADAARSSNETKEKYSREQQIEIERLKSKVSELTGELHRRMCEKVFLCHQSRVNPD